MQLVGVIVGSYSSIFLATPLLVTLRERTELVRTHTRRVLNRRKPRQGRRGGAGRRAGGGGARRWPPSRRRRSLRPGRGPSGRPPAGPDDRRVSETPGGGRGDGPPQAGGPPACEGEASAPVRSRSVVTAAVLSLIGGLGLSACSGSPADSIDYAVDGTLVTYNTNTVAGAASGGPQAFARVLTGFNYHGPDGQIVGDHDFGSISVVGRAPLVLDYEISANAVYSDGKPITCDDMVLAWASQSGRLPGFDAANRAGYSDIASVDCAPGQKKARVTFAQDRGFVDFGQLFTATSMMPSHVIADELGIDVTTALLNNDGPAVERIAQVWNNTWNLSADDFDTKRFPSSGPYKIESVNKDGSVVLVANDKWWGAKPVTNKITVWPRGADIQDKVNQGAYDVVDIATGSSGTLNLPDDYVRTDSPVGRHRTAHLRAAGPDGRPARASGAGAVHAARSDRPERGVADRQRPAQPGDRGCVRRGRGRRRGRTVRRRQSRRRPRRDQQPAADRAHRLSEPERPAGRDRRCDRQGLRAGRNHRAGRRLGHRRPATVCATTRLTC